MKNKILVTQKLIFLLLVVATLLAPPLTTRSQVTAHYNVLLIVVDDMNDRISFLGNSEAVSPNLQRLVARGMVFTHVACQYALCNPSRTSFLSGWRPDKTRIFQNHVRPRSLMGADVKFLPEYFKQYGYQTERFGKIMHNLYEDDITWDYAEPPAAKRDVNSNTPGINKCKNTYGTTAGPDWWIADISNPRANHLVAHLQQRSQGQPFFYASGFPFITRLLQV
jgi:arylsulfatase A-like enzyme